jgi:hypothetical protein
MKAQRLGLIIFLIILSNCLKSQESYFGLSSGFNLSNFNSPKLAQAEYKFGPNVNIIYDRSLIKHLDYRIGLSYYNIGNKSADIIFTDEYNNLLGTGQLIWSNDYLALPVIIKPYIGDKIKGYLKIGFNFSYLINNKFSVTNNYKINGNGGIEFNKFDFGQLLGIGIEFPLNANYYFGIETEAYYGYLNIDKYNGPLRNHFISIDFLLKYKIK